MAEVVGKLEGGGEQGLVQTTREKAGVGQEGGLVQGGVEELWEEETRGRGEAVVVVVEEQSTGGGASR